MRTTQRLAAIAGALLLLLAAGFPAAASSFEDMEQFAWADEAVTALADAGIIQGVDETHFAPQDNIRRADFVILLVKTFGYRTTEPDVFTDVKINPYYYTTVVAAREAGLITGDAEGRFWPNDPITRQDMFTMTYRALQKEGSIPLEETGEIGLYADLSDTAVYAQPAVIALTVNDFISGADGLIRPEDHATRAETAVFLHRIYQQRQQANK